MASDMLSPHFTDDEFRCKHCGALHANGVSASLIMTLEFVRCYFGGKPVMINSGYRCPEHNAAVGGSANSRHMYGDAADIVVDGVHASQVFGLLAPWHEGGLGKYDTFTHVDTRGHAARWSG